MTTTPRQLAVVTGASSGIGYELARLCAEYGYDLIVAADEAGIHDVAEELATLDVSVESIEVDLSTTEGVDKLCEVIGARNVDALLANAGHGLGGAFLDQGFEDARHVLDTNITGTIYLIHKLANDMRLRGKGRILITGSVAGYQPGSFQAVYNGSKAFIDSFAAALRNELKDSGVSVTCLMPGATDTNFFVRAKMLDTKVAQGEKADPADVAQVGFDAMLAGDDAVIEGLENKLQVAASHFIPDSILAEQHRKKAEPGSASKS
jgi:uncharacterized protein